MLRTRSRTIYGGTIVKTPTSNYQSVPAPLVGREWTLVETMVDVTGPLSLYLLRSGRVVNNPCTWTKVLETYGQGGSQRNTRISDPSKYYNILGTGSLSWYCAARGVSPGYATVPLSVTLTDMELVAKSKALASIDKAPYAMAEDIATIRETVRFLRNPFSALDSLSKSFEKERRGLRSVRKKSRLSRDAAISSLWLEHRFAFKPLVQTVSRGIDSLARSDKRYDRIMTAHGSDSRQNSVHDTTTASSYTWDRSSKRKVVANATIQYRVTPPLSSWRAKYGLRTKDIPELLWDLFPLSFMYDRVFNIGNAIRGMTNILDPSVSILGGSFSTLDELEQRLKFLSFSAGGWKYNWQLDSGISKVTSTYNRVAWTPNALDAIPPVLPMDLVSDLTSIADLCSLVIQRLR